MRKHRTFSLGLFLGGFLAVAGCGSGEAQQDSPLTGPDEEPGIDATPSDGTGGGAGGGGTAPTSPASPKSLTSCFAADFDAPGAGSGEGAAAGEPCTWTVECVAPLMCIGGAGEGICAETELQDRHCVADEDCTEEGAACVNFQCVDLGGYQCNSKNPCPRGYECKWQGFPNVLQHRCELTEIECPAEGEPCAECTVDGHCDAGERCSAGACAPLDQCSYAADLRGVFDRESVLNLGAADGGAIDQLVDSTQWMRDMINKGIVPNQSLSAMAAALISDMLGIQVAPEFIDLVVALPELQNIVEDVRVTHKMDLDAACGEMYRGSLSFEQIELAYRGKTFVKRPEEISAMGAIEPAQFGAFRGCNSLVMDEITVNRFAAGMFRWATQVFTQEVTKGRYDNLEVALLDAVPCEAIYLIPELAAMAPILVKACDMAIEQTSKALPKILDWSTNVDKADMACEVEVVDGARLGSGPWVGSITGDFYAQGEAPPRNEPAAP